MIANIAVKIVIVWPLGRLVWAVNLSPIILIKFPSITAAGLGIAKYFLPKWLNKIAAGIEPKKDAHIRGLTIQRKDSRGINTMVLPKYVMFCQIIDGTNWEESE